jgi:hypothetical protein
MANDMLNAAVESGPELLQRSLIHPCPGDPGFRKENAWDVTRALEFRWPHLATSFQAIAVVRIRRSFDAIRPCFVSSFRVSSPLDASVILPLNICTSPMRLTVCGRKPGMQTESARTQSKAGQVTRGKTQRCIGSPLRWHQTFGHCR